MQRHHLVTCFITLLVGLFILGITSSALAHTHVYFNPGSDTVVIGDSFSIDILANITNPILGFGLDLTFSDNSILTFDGYSVGTGFFQTPPDLDPEIDLGALAMPSSISGAGVLLACLDFTAAACGDTDLLLSATFGDFTEGFPLDPFGFDTWTYDSGNISVSVVPEPSTLLLALFGLIGLVAVRKKIG